MTMHATARAVAHRSAKPIGCVAAVLAACAVVAQPVGAPASAGAAPASAASAPSPAALAPYVDRVIDASSASNDEPDALPERTFDATGWPRHVRIDLRSLRERANVGSAYASQGVAMFGAIETPNHGLWSLDLNLRRENRTVDVSAFSTSGGSTDASAGQAVLGTLRQRAFPWGGGLLMNNDLGVIGFASPGLGRMTSRVSMPSHRALGVGTQLLHDEQGWSWGGSVGQPLQFDGVYASRVQRVPGTLVQTGAQLNQKWGADGMWHLGTQWLQARDVSTQGIYGTGLPQGATPSTFDAQSIWLGAGAVQGGLQMQAHAVGSRLDASAKGASRGAWADLAWQDGALRHGGGVYALEQGLSWGGLPMSNGLSGAYLRSAWYSRTWLLDGSVDVLRSHSASASQGYFVTATMRRREDSTLSWGLSTALRDFNGRGTTAAADASLRSDFGNSNLRGDLTHELDGQRTWRVTLHHDWDAASGWTLANSAAYGRTRSGLATSPLWLLAASAYAPLTARLSFRGTAALEEVSNNPRRAVNLAFNYQLLQDWMFELGASVERGRGQTARSLDPLAPPNLVAAQAVNSQSLYVLLRYEFHAGTRAWPLGGRARDGGGAVEGVVFLDTNKNGLQDAGERGAAGVTVALDGKYLTQTNGDGRFEFPWVGSGARQVTILNETLPLPWSAPEGGRTDVQVFLRDTVRLTLGVTQP